MSYTLRYLGDPVLKTKSTSILNTSDIPKDLVPLMVRFVADENALGLAAPQVGISLRLAVLRLEEGFFVVINPYGIILEGPITHEIEGCLSIPGFETTVPRFSTIKFHFQTVKGETFSKELTGLEARVAQHEFDHLDGKLITDYCSRQRRRLAERTVRSLFPEPLVYRQ